MSLSPIARLMLLGCFWCTSVGLIPMNSLGQEPGKPPMPGDDDPPLPKLIDMPLPSAESLLNDPPRDWIVLLNQDVLVVEPVTPRPDTLAKRKVDLEKAQKSNPAVVGAENRTRMIFDAERLAITLQDQSVEPEFLLQTRYIDKIIHYEDLLLQRVSALLDVRNLPLAFDLLTVVDRRAKSWPGYDQQYHRALFVEAEVLLQNGRPEAALTALEHLTPLVPDYPHLSALQGLVVGPLIQSAVDKEDYRQARHFLARLFKLNAEHPVAKEWRQRLVDAASAAAEQARQATAENRFRDAAAVIDRAARIWPELAGLKDQHKTQTERYQILRVGDWLPPDGPVTGRAAERHRRLGSIPLFEPHRIVDGAIRYRSAFFEQWDPTDLGRRWTFRLRPRRADSDSRPVLSAGQIAETIRRRLDPTHADYDERCAAIIADVQAPNPGVLTLELHQIPLRIEALLRFVVPLDPASNAWNADLSPAAFTDPAAQRFFLAEVNAQRVVLRRSRPEPEALKVRHLVELEELRYADWERALQGLLRGEIDAVPLTEYRDVRGLQADSRFFVLPHALPRTHLICIHPASPLARNSSWRRALSLAIPRESILRELVLDGQDPQFGRLSVGPFASTLTAAPRLLAPPPHDPSAALALLSTAKKEAGGTLPPLKLLAPTEPTVARALPALLAAWKRTGIAVEPITDPHADWDLSYRTLQLTEPVVDFWPLIAPRGRAELAAITPFPHPVREQFLELDRTIDWTSALRQLERLQSEFHAEARYLPLWEVEEFTTVRRRVGNMLARPLDPYQECERWAVQSWYPTETP